MGIKLKSKAKINLSIDVLGKREDGYHNVEMVMQTIGLYDIVTIEENISGDIAIKSDTLNIPCDERNIAYKAASLMKKFIGTDKGADIYIQKRIPVGAGMAGGSSNAAAVLIGLNRIWKAGLSETELMEMGVKLGADVPFCIKGGSMLAQGIGEKLTSIEKACDFWVVVCKPNFSISTVEVYKNLDLAGVVERPDTARVIEYIENGDIKSLAGSMVNVLEEVSEKRYSVISHIKEKMMHQKALGSIMTGSGPTVFGIFKNFDDAHRAESKLKSLWDQTYLTKTEDEGVEVYEG